jgi:hypothetical protein
LSNSQFKPRKFFTLLLQGRALIARIAISVRMNNFIFLKLILSPLRGRRTDFGVGGSFG